MDRELSNRQRRQASLRGALKLAAVVALVVSAGAAGRQWLSPAIELSDVRVATVERGPIEATVTATGTILPRTEQTISSPVGAEIRRIHVTAGETVVRDQVIMQLDTTASALSLDNLDALFG